MSTVGGDLGVVLVTYDSADCVADSLRSVREHLPDAEILVVDNGSTDTTLDVARAAAPDAELIEAGGNLGYGRACNLAAERTDRSHLLFLNPDVVVETADAGSLDSLLSRPRLGLVAPTLRVLTRRGWRELRVGGEPHWLRDVVANTLEPLRPRELQGIGRGLHRPKGGVAWASGAALLVRRSEFLGLGGFDARFFLYYEDRDLSARYRRAGLPVRSSDALVARHAQGKSSAGDLLRVEPTGWAILGWLQYLHIWRGPELAGRAARLATRTLAGAERSLRAASALTRGGTRLGRKHRQLHALLDFLREQAGTDPGAPGAGFCPDARAVLRERWPVREERPANGRVEVLGCSIDSLTFEETVQRCDELIRARTGARHTSINAAKVVAAQRDPRLRAALDASEIVNADGQSVVWASWLLGRRLPARVAGIDLMDALLAVAEQRGYSVYLLGARQGVLEQAVRELERRFPSLRLAGYRNGYFDANAEEEVDAAIRKANPDLLFVAMSSPRKEHWIDDHARDLGVPLVMGVGGAVDVLAGKARRAPVWMQRLGLEWLFRLLQEPRRLWRRYLTTNTRFGLLVGAELVRRLRPTKARGAPSG